MRGGHERHLEETRAQVERLRGRPEAHGGSPSTAKGMAAGAGAQPGQEEAMASFLDGCWDAAGERSLKEEGATA